MTVKQLIGLVASIAVLWFADGLFRPSLGAWIVMGLVVASWLYSFHEIGRRDERQEIIEAARVKADEMIDVLRGIDTSLRVRHDPELERIAAAFGYDAVLTFPRHRDFYDREDYLEALAKWKAALSNDRPEPE